MPALYAHNRFGEDVLATMPPALKGFFEKYTEAFHLGLQGPDILFYYKPLTKNTIKKYGMALHHETGRGFYLEAAERIFNDEKNKTEDGTFFPDTAYAAYIGGMICHFTLDCSLHGLINEKTTEKTTHGKIESEFDKYLMRMDSKAIRGVNNAGHLTDKNGTAEACAEAYDIDLTEIKRCIKTIRRINGWFGAKSEAFHVFAHAFLTLARMERKFGDMFLHKKDDPNCAKLNEKLYKRYKTAIPKASAVLEEYFTNLPLCVKNKQLNALFKNTYAGDNA